MINLDFYDVAAYLIIGLTVGYFVGAWQQSGLTLLAFIKEYL